MLDVMIVLRLKRIDHAEPAIAMTDDDVSKVVAEAISARFPKQIGYGPPATTIVHADGTTPRPSVILALQECRVMVVRPETLPEHVNGATESVPVGPRIVT